MAELRIGGDERCSICRPQRRWRAYTGTCALEFVVGQPSLQWTGSPTNGTTAMPRMAMHVPADTTSPAGAACTHGRAGRPIDPGHQRW